MSGSTTYLVGAATEAELLAHLNACAAQFVPALDSRVDIPHYAAKLHKHATCFEAWLNGSLVGMIAAYTNDPTKQDAFVTSVSVLPDFKGLGLASRLVSNCIAHCRELHFCRIGLEVHSENTRARNLYLKSGFLPIESTGSTIRMVLRLTD